MIGACVPRSEFIMESKVDGKKGEGRRRDGTINRDISVVCVKKTWYDRVE